MRKLTDHAQPNILIDVNKHALLTDFGISTFLHTTGTLHATAVRGTTRWMPPEFFKHDDDEDTGKPSVASDVYSMGLVFWAVSTFSTSGVKTYSLTCFTSYTLGRPRSKRIEQTLSLWCSSLQASDRIALPTRNSLHFPMSYGRFSNGCGLLTLMAALDWTKS